MLVLKSLFVAVSMYSRIPVPRTVWTEQSMKYAMCFFPVVGIFIGAAVLAAGMIMRSVCGSLIFSAVMTVIPVIITGGIHLDGFLDTSDALASYEGKEKKLEILKDPNSGAFAVIAAAVYFTLSLGGWSIISADDIIIISLFYCVSRALSGISIVSFPLAKKTGLAAMFSDAAHKSRVRAALVMWLLAASAAAVCIDCASALTAVFMSAVMFVIYYFVGKKHFGGITGDTAGWFLQLCELLVLLAVGAGSLIM